MPLGDADTRAKRMSAASMLLPSHPLIEASGSIDPQDWPAGAQVYNGITISEPVLRPFVVGNDADTILLLHLDTEEGSTEFRDSSLSGNYGQGHVVQASGDAKVTHAQARYDPGSLDGDGGAYAFIAPHPDFDFGTGDWTIDLWAYTINDRAHLISWHTSETTRFEIGMIGVNNGEPYYVARFIDSGVTLFETITDPLPGQNRWTHFALERFGTTVTFYIDGNVWERMTILDTTQVNLGGETLEIGRQTELAFDGWMDEVRISRVARYESTGFAPETFPYSAVRSGTLSGRFGIAAVRNGLISGAWDMVVSRRTGFVSGAFHVINLRGGNVSGAYIPGPWGGNISGRYDQVVSNRNGKVGGAYRLANVVGGNARGGYAITSPREGSLRGAYQLFKTSDGLVRGAFSILTSYSGRVSGAALVLGSPEQWELYHGVDAEPDFDAPPEQVSTLSPFVTAPLTFPAVHNFALRTRNAVGLLSQNIQAWTIELDDSGQEIPGDPSAPTEMAVNPAAGGTYEVVAKYLYLGDSPDRRATHWRVWTTNDGTDPDRLVDPIVLEEAMVFTDGVAKLKYAPGISEAEGTLIKADVATVRQSVAADTDSPVGEIVDANVTFDGPVLPAPIQVT